VFCFSVAYCRAILFVRTGRNMFGEYFLMNFRFIYVVDLYYFPPVSAVPVGASDRVAGLLSRVWWQG
jgi:hypothetical protein